MTNVFVVKESNDSRVSLDIVTVERFVKQGLSVFVESNAGKKSFFTDEKYKSVGATIVSREEGCSKASIVFSINALDTDTIAKLNNGASSFSLVVAYKNKKSIKATQDKNINLYALELIPRITRAQSMDVLSSQAASAGYKASLIAANLYCGFFPMLTTAAGTIRPARTVIVGAGVAGLQAIATCKRLGSIVEAYDIRPAAKEQIESLGASMIDTGVDASGDGGYARQLTKEEQEIQAEVLAKHIAKANIVITTAAIPGRESPKIVTKSMVDNMQYGSVIVDLASDGGGNCELTKPGSSYLYENKVTIDGTLQMASGIPRDSSQMFAKNIFNLLSPFIKDGSYEPDFEDEVIKNCLIVKDGSICNDSIKNIMEDK